MKSGARCPYVVIHLPAWPEPIAFVGLAHHFDHFAPHYITEISQAIERLQAAAGDAEALAADQRNVAQFLLCIARVGKQALLVPGAIGGWTHQTAFRIIAKGGQQVIEPAGRNLNAAFQQDVDIRRLLDELVKTGCTAERCIGPGLFLRPHFGCQFLSRRIRTVKD